MEISNVTETTKAANTTKTFSSIDEMVKSLEGKHVETLLDSGSRLWGVLEGFDDQWLFIRGYKGQPIIVKRRKMASLVEAV